MSEFTIVGALLHLSLDTQCLLFLWHEHELSTDWQLESYLAFGDFSSVHHRFIRHAAWLLGMHAPTQTQADLPHLSVCGTVILPLWK